MGTLSEKVNKVAETKASIKTAIESKGVTVSDTDTFASYADKINSIQTGGGSSTSSGDISGFLLKEGQTITIPENVTKIDDYTFLNFKNSTVIANHPVEFAPLAFSGCDNVTLRYMGKEEVISFPRVRTNRYVNDNSSGLYGTIYAESNYLVALEEGAYKVATSTGVITGKNHYLEPEEGFVNFNSEGTSGGYEESIASKPYLRVQTTYYFKDYAPLYLGEIPIRYKNNNTDYSFWSEEDLQNNETMDTDNVVVINPYKTPEASIRINYLGEEANPAISLTFKDKKAGSSSNVITWDSNKCVVYPGTDVVYRVDDGVNAINIGTVTVNDNITVDVTPIPSETENVTLSETFESSSYSKDYLENVLTVSENYNAGFVIDSETKTLRSDLNATTGKSISYGYITLITPPEGGTISVTASLTYPEGESSDSGVGAFVYVGTDPVSISRYQYISSRVPTVSSGQYLLYSTSAVEEETYTYTKTVKGHELYYIQLLATRAYSSSGAAPQLNIKSISFVAEKQ